MQDISILAVGSNLQIRPILPTESVTQLIANSFIPMIVGKKFIQGAKASLHLHQCTSLAKHLSIRVLERPRSLELLPEIAQLVEEDLVHESQTACA